MMPMKPELFKTTVPPWAMLLGTMCMHNVSRKQLARMLNRGSTYVSLRLNGHALWAMEDALKMMKAFQIEPEDFLRYFGQEPVDMKLLQGGK